MSKKEECRGCKARDEHRKALEQEIVTLNEKLRVLEDVRKTQVDELLEREKVLLEDIADLLVRCV